jgi:hypothetical protein
MTSTSRLVTTVVGSRVAHKDAEEDPVRSLGGALRAPPTHRGAAPEGHLFTVSAGDRRAPSPGATLLQRRWSGPRRLVRSAGIASGTSRRTGTRRCIPPGHCRPPARTTRSARRVGSKTCRGASRSSRLNRPPLGHRPCVSLDGEITTYCSRYYHGCTRMSRRTNTHGRQLLTRSCARPRREPRQSLRCELVACGMFIRIPARTAAAGRPVVARVSAAVVAGADQ